MTDQPVPEFSRPLLVDHMAGDQVTQQLCASTAECQALAQRFGVVAIEQLAATVQVTRLAHGRMARVQGSVRATVRQVCVVTVRSAGRPAMAWLMALV